jgi:nicotinamide-nucleotide amidase
MRAEVVAVGTELLLGQVVDTNSSWMGEQLAAAGIDSFFQTKVGDNQARIVLAIREALARSDAVIVCGGLGPTQDDITREAIAEVMHAEFRRDPAILERIRGMFDARGRAMAANNARQADVPDGATPILQVRGTAPGLICPVGHKVVYAVPGVPHEMQEMITRAVIPDLQARGGEAMTIRSRVLRTWGLAESTLAEVVAPRLEALDAEIGGDPRAPGPATLAFLASGMEGIKVRITAKAPTAAEADAVLTEEERALKELLGDVVFGVDDETMESAVAELLIAQGLTLGVAESLTGGLVGARLTAVPGASNWFRGSIVAYDSAVKHALLGVPDGPVVSGEAAEAMASGAARVLGADVGLGVTGVAGPTEQEGQPVGTVWLGLHLDGRTEATRIQLPGDRERVRQFATISLLDQLRRRLRTRGA